MHRILFCIALLFTVCSSSQKIPETQYEFDANYFYGSLLEHNKSIQHLITAHPNGLLLSYSRKTFGVQDWSNAYNAPDYGYSFLYQDFNNPILGESYSLFGHFSFYFLNRNLMVRLAQGITYTTNPYDADTNFRNNAHGTTLSSAEYLMVNYKKENIYKGIGVQAGFSIIHYSNGNLKAPNTSTNTWFFGLGLNYNPNYKALPDYESKRKLKDYSEPIHYNLAIRSGVNSSDVIGLGQYIHYTFSGYVDKRFNLKSTLQAGIDVFVSPMLKSLIEYRAITFPELNLDSNANSNRVGIFIGHLLTFNRTAVVTHLGYYAYYPYEFEGRIYNRLGIQRTFGKHFFGGISVHAHAASAESLEFSIGYRL